MIVVSTREEFDYVMEADRDLPKEQQTVFRLRPLSLRESNEIEDLIGLGGGEGFPAGTVHTKTIKYGLVNWCNLKDQDGVSVGFEKKDGLIKDKMLSMFTTAQRTELFNAIWEGATVTPGDSKK